MTGYGTLMVVSGAAILALVVFTWLLSLRLRDASIVDVAFVAGIVLVAWLAFAIAEGSAARKVLVVTLTTLWGLRLAGYITRRKLGEGEDFRYEELRQRYGERFPIVSLVVVFLFQGAGIWAVSLPVQTAQVPDSPQGLVLLDFVGIAVWSVGMLFESVADFQLARFRADPRNRGKVMDSGLWRYSRHPNYFGEFCIWWGLYAVALATVEAWWSIIGPLTMSFILIRLFGVPAMEPHLSRTKEGYEDYVRRTSAFLPKPPRRT
jgi:steroid 5-alpha reductase family enzyme